jgi:hypothetical protein
LEHSLEILLFDRWLRLFVRLPPCGLCLTPLELFNLWTACDLHALLLLTQDAPSAVVYVPSSCFTDNTLTQCHVGTTYPRVARLTQSHCSVVHHWYLICLPPVSFPPCFACFYLSFRHDVPYSLFLCSSSRLLSFYFSCTAITTWKSSYLRKYLLCLIRCACRTIKIRSSMVTSQTQYCPFVSSQYH